MLSNNMYYLCSFHMKQAESFCPGTSILTAARKVSLSVFIIAHFLHEQGRLVVHRFVIGYPHQNAQIHLKMDWIPAHLRPNCSFQ